MSIRGHLKNRIFTYAKLGQAIDIQDIVDSEHTTTICPWQQAFNRLNSLMVRCRYRT